MRASESISNSEKVIDSRDVIARIEYLESERKSLEPPETAQEWDDEFGDELKALRDVAEAGKRCSSDWTYGATLVHEAYWIEYVEEMLKEIGDLPQDIPHYIEIDWDKTADNILVDYSEIDFDGSTYYIRAS